MFFAIPATFFCCDCFSKGCEKCRQRFLHEDFRKDFGYTREANHGRLKIAAIAACSQAWRRSRRATSSRIRIQRDEP